MERFLILQRLSVDISSVSYADDENDQTSILYVINDSIITDPNSIGMIRSDKLLASHRHRIIGQALHGFDDSGDPLAVNRSSVLLRRARNLNAE